MTRRATLRASDADRELVAERLRMAAAEGRLFPDELEERIGTALVARTYGELDALVADLPQSRAAQPQMRYSRGRRPIRSLAAVIPLSLLLAGLLAAALSGHGHPYHHWGGGVRSEAWLIWVIWPAIGCMLLMRRRGRTG